MRNVFLTLALGFLLLSPLIAGDKHRNWQQGVLKTISTDTDTGREVASYTIETGEYVYVVKRKVGHRDKPLLVTVNDPVRFAVEGQDFYLVDEQGKEHKLLLDRRTHTDEDAQLPREGGEIPQCMPGYMWREARHGDHVCVTARVRQQALDDNAADSQRHQPGTDFCMQGYVWREALPADHVCVLPATREQARIDNAQADLHLQSPQLASGTVTTVSLRVSPQKFQGPCPATIKFEGEITVGGPATVAYHFIRSDGATGPRQIIQADHAGSFPLSTEWHLGGAGTKFSGWEQAVVLNQTGTVSNHADFSIDCE